MSDERVLLLVAVNTDQPNIKRRMEIILAAAEPREILCNAEVFAKTVDELADDDLDRLACLIGVDSVQRLDIGACPAGGKHVLSRFGPECSSCGEPRPKVEPREP